MSATTPTLRVARLKVLPPVPLPSQISEHYVNQVTRIQEGAFGEWQRARTGPFYLPMRNIDDVASARNNRRGPRTAFIFRNVVENIIYTAAGVD